MTTMSAPVDWRERGLVGVATAGAVVGVGRTTAYEMVKSGQMPSMIVGRRVMVPTAWLRRLIDDGVPIGGAA